MDFQLQVSLIIERINKHKLKDVYFKQDPTGIMLASKVKELVGDKVRVRLLDESIGLKYFTIVKSKDLPKGLL